MGLALVMVGVVAIPFGAASGGGGSHAGVLGIGIDCGDKMLAELGWTDAPGGTAEGAAGVPDLPEAVAAPLPAWEGSPDLHECTGTIQPGAQMTNGCTMNFIFRDAQGNLYLGTAGHCTGGVGSTIGIVGVGNNVATVVYDGYPGPIDFALARISPAFHARVDPTMCHWGGPSAVNDAPQRGQTTHIYGFGSIYGQGPETRPRPGVVYSAGSSEVTYIGAAQPGDSGSPLVSGDGKALGVHVRSSLSVGSIRVDPSQKFATRVDAAILRAEQGTGLDLELVTSGVPFNLLGY